MTEIEDQTAVATVHPDPDLQNVTITATSPKALPHLQENLIGWCRQKVAVCKREAREMAQAHKHAKERKWATSALAAAERRAKRVADFYEKALIALEAGYCLFPATEADLFSVRTGKNAPRWKQAIDRWRAPNELFEVPPEFLPAGEGRYVSSDARVQKTHEKEIKNAAGVVTEVQKYFTRTGFNEEVAFPMMACKPELMEVTDRAMALKVFDEIGVLPASRKADPAVVGRIVDPIRREGYHGPYKRLTFLIAWFVNTRDL